MGEDNLAHQNERYQLNWAGKTDAYRTFQSPTFNTLAPCQSESVDFNQTQNIFIEAENMEALKILQKSYAGKVKMIYIDPPYNTGSDSFIYPDKFSETRKEYAQRVGDTDTDGYLKRDGVFQGAFRKNSKENGHYHSNWLSMMLPRLHLAKTLLRDDGVIFISIDDNEQAQLKLLCDEEVFGAENFVGEVIWERAYSPVNLKRHFSESHDYLLCYAKNKDLAVCNGLKRNDEANSRYSNPDNDSRGIWKSSDLSVGPAIESNIYEITTPSGRKVLPPSGYSWRLNKERFQEFVSDNRIWFGETGNNVPSIKRFLSEVKNTVTPMTIWKYQDVGHSQSASQDLKRLFDNKAFFDYPKPTNFVQRMLELYSNSDSIIMDFFSGSGTTAHAVMQLNAEDGGNRRYICVQLPEECDPKSEAAKAGFANIAEIAKERIRRAGSQISGSLKDNQSVDTGFKVFKLAESNFKRWQKPDLAQLGETLEIFTDTQAAHATPENMVYELLLRLGLPLTADVSSENGVYWLRDDNRRYALLLSELSENLLLNVISQKPNKIIILDNLFNSKDALKKNMALQMHDAGIPFECV
ncbi:site-specific DNA-methyltransferase [Simonsiella muelleri]|uniref:site-specific DNA-methyltransferase n=1 Tax=Simonsiella muelleri TaxID=72 RepID=UPI0001D0A52C